MAHNRPGACSSYLWRRPPFRFPQQVRVNNTLTPGDPPRSVNRRRARCEDCVTIYCFSPLKGDTPQVSGIEAFKRQTGKREPRSYGLPRGDCCKAPKDYGIKKARPTLPQTLFIPFPFGPPGQPASVLLSFFRFFFSKAFHGLSDTLPK